MVMASFQRQFATCTDLVARWTTRADAPAAAAVIGGAVIGYMVQSAFTDGDIDPNQYYFRSQTRIESA
jgi:hypothetical protein